VSQTQTAGAYRLVLNLMPAEPFVSADAKANSGMVAIAGAAPVQPTSASHPNHHLVVHVYRADGTAVAGATVSMTVTGTDAVALHVPVVEMQMAGKGPGSTHYGNNVALAPGSYTVEVTVGDGPAATFQITVT